MALEALHDDVGRLQTNIFKEDLQNLSRAREILPAFLKPATSQTVPVNVAYQDDSVRVVAEVPGVALEELSVVVEGKNLEISGQRQPRPQVSGTKVMRQERWTGEFRRLVELPFEVDSDSVEAMCSRGVLTVTLKRRQSIQPRKIAIRGE